MNEFTTRQKEIIDVSITIISRQGIQQLTMKNISKKMKISEPAIYRHFDSKMDILLAILSVFKENNPRLLEIMNSNKMTSITKIESIFSHNFKQFVVNPSLAAVIFSEGIFQNDKRLAEQVNMIILSRQNMISRIIEQGQKNDEIRDDISKEQLALIIMGALRLIVTKWQLSKYSFDLEIEGKELWRAINSILLK